MIGIILGDIIGNNCENEKEQNALFTKDGKYTINTILTLNMIKEIINSKKVKYLNTNVHLDKEILSRACVIGFYYDSFIEVLEKSNISIKKDINKVENIIALVAYLSKSCMKKEHIQEVIKNRVSNNYKLTDNEETNDVLKRSLDIFFTSNSFEEAMRKGILNSKKTSTICSIVGGLMESYYGIPNELINIAYEYLNEEDARLLNEFYLKKDYKVLRKE